MVQEIDPRPKNCRFRLRDEGQPYPRSGCNACARTILTGLGESCFLEKKPEQKEEPSEWTQTDELAAQFMAALIVANPETTDTYFLVRVAFKCAGVFEAERLRCAWKYKFLPPPVFRERLWGMNSPKTNADWAQDCAQFTPRPTESKGTEG